MSLLANLKSDESIANERDSVGGSVLDSGLYKAKVVLAYLIKATSGAIGLALTLKTDGGAEIRQTVYMTSGTAKGGKNYYEKDGQKNYLPGFLTANSLALLTVGKEISELDPEPKVVPVYSKEAKAEVPTKVAMLVELLGKEILVGLIRQTVDKTKKDDAGEYQPTGEVRDENEIDKLFRASDRMTTAEIRAKAEAAAFAATWEAKFTGVVKNKVKGAAGGSGVAGAPKGAAVSAKPRASLFGS